MVLFIEALREGMPMYIVDVDDGDGDEEVEISIHRKHSGKVGSFFAAELPGCCGVLVIHHIDMVGRRSENLPSLVEKIVEAAGVEGYGTVLMTTLEDSKLYKALWAITEGSGTHFFVNHKTGNGLMSFFLDTKPPKNRVV